MNQRNIYNEAILQKQLTRFSRLEYMLSLSTPKQWAVNKHGADLQIIKK